MIKKFLPSPLARQRSSVTTISRAAASAADEMYNKAESSVPLHIQNEILELLTPFSADDENCENHNDDNSNSSEISAASLVGAECNESNDIVTVRQPQEQRQQRRQQLQKQQSSTHLSWRDIHVKSLIGSGGFCNVYKVTVAATATSNNRVSFLSSSSASSSSGSAAPSGENIVTNADNNSNRMKDVESDFFALKRLKGSRSSMRECELDIAHEADILSQLHEHENIITMYASHTVLDGDLYTETGGGAQFLLLEVLKSTLSDNIQSWRRSINGTAGFFRRHRFLRRGSSSSGRSIKPVSPSSPSSSLQFFDSCPPSLADRVSVCAIGIARAMDFIHKQKIVVRDLKPANIGFGRDGKIKLFDFGLARRQKSSSSSSCDDDDDEGEIIGTFRYMAPEAMAGNGGTYACDVYSFGILLWELVTLERPFGGFTSPRRLIHHVQELNRRPPVSSCFLSKAYFPPAAKKLKETVCKSWSSCPALRPNFSSILQMLEESISKLKVKK